VTPLDFGNGVDTISRLKPMLNNIVTVARNQLLVNRDNRLE